MKIGIVVSDPCSGLLFYPVQLALAFKYMGHEVIAFSWSNQGQNNGLYEQLISNSIIVEYVDILRYSTSIKALITGIQPSPRLKKINLNLLITFGPLASWQLRNTININPRGKIIAMVEAMGHDKESFWKPLVGATLLNRNTDYVIALCYLEKQRLESLKVNKEKLKIIFNPINIELVNEISNKNKKIGKNVFFKNIGLDPRKRYTACLASFQPRKRQDLLIRAFAAICSQYPEMDLVLAGKGKEIDKCKELAKSIQVEDRVHFVGHLKNEDALHLIQCADVIAHCSNAETFGYSMVEPLLFEKKVITTKIGIGWELEQSDLAEVVPPDDLDQLTAGLTKVLKGGSEIENRKLRGKAFVEEHCSVQKIAEKLILLANY